MLRLSELPEIDKSLRQYQISGKRDIYHVWDSCRTVLFQMPTGTGKTRLFSSIIKDTQRLAQVERRRFGVLVLAHRTELIQQIDETLSLKYGIAHGIIKSGVDENAMFPVQVASVQTIARRLDKWAPKGFSYIIIDEAHHAVSPTYLKICKAFPDAKILGVTATPCRLSGDALRKLFGALVLSQPVNKFIEQGYLSPYHYFSIKPDSRIQTELDNISHFNIEGDYAEADMMRICDTSKVRANIIRAYLKYAKGKKGIIYTINQEHNKHICEEFEKIGVKIKAIDSKTPNEERRNTVAAFKAGRIDIICNVNIFSEGFDCPDCEFIQLARPTCSLSMYLQQVGRGLRPHPNKTQAIILDNVGSYNKFGLPSANRRWRNHFEGYGQRVTQSSNGGGCIGGYSKSHIQEGDEEMVLIFSGKEIALTTNKAETDGYLKAIVDTRAWFPFGGISLLQNASGEGEFKSFFRLFHDQFKDEEEWLDYIDEELGYLVEQEEFDWLDRKISRICKFRHNGLYGICELKVPRHLLNEEWELFCKGERRAEDIYSLILPPVYDEFFIPDSQDRMICKKNGKFGVLSGESLLPIIPFEYNDIEFQGNGLYLANKNGFIGLTGQERTIIPFEYDEIQDLPIGAYNVCYLIHKEDSYSLAYLNEKLTGFEISPILVTHTLINDFHLGLSDRNHAFICDKNGNILFPFNFERIGVGIIKDKFEIIFTTRSYGIVLNEDLDIKEEIDSIPKSDKEFKAKYHLDKFFAARNNKIVDKTLVKDSAKDSKKVEKAIANNSTEIITDEDTTEALEIITDTVPEMKEITLPKGVFVGENGLKGYSIKNRVILKAEFEDIEIISPTRLIVRKSGKMGVIAVKNLVSELIIPIIFDNLSDSPKQQNYCIDRKHIYREDLLRKIKFYTGKHLVIHSNGYDEIYYNNQKVAKYLEINRLIDELFIIKDATNKYGIIRCLTKHATLIRKPKYTNITLTEDGNGILLYKEKGRPRFMSINTLSGE